MSQLVLYQLGLSHYCEKVRWALAHKQIKHVKKNLLVGLHMRTTRKLTGKTELPVIQRGSTIVTDSASIITWLDQNYPEHPLTPDRELEQEALDWELFADEAIGPHVRRICYHTLIQHKSVVLPLFTQNGPWYGRALMPLIYPRLQPLMIRYLKLDDATTRESITEIDLALQRINTHLLDHQYLVGDTFSRADLAVASLLAPLCMPAGYGLQWPARLPEPLASTIARFKPKLQWVQHIYDQHRETNEINRSSEKPEVRHV